MNSYTRIYNFGYHSTDDRLKGNDRVAEELKETLVQCGLTYLKLGTTYTADRLHHTGSKITSCIHHIYISQDFEPHLNTVKLDNSATDGRP